MDWYENRQKLKPGQVFKDFEGDLIRLDHRVPGDGTKWSCDLWFNDHWSCEEIQIEPGDLVEMVPDPEKNP